MKSEIHKLLYRLAEIMLQQEQHVLPVDLLFDDAQIGEFVKSIQIDSPYQQLLLEGVLTESVREEKLYVSFSVEGYFHYVLGEVIHSQSDGKDINYFLSLFQNKLKGVAEGVENCLIRDIQEGISSRLIDLIDAGGLALDACVTPLASFFLFVAIKKSKEEEDTQKSHVSQVIDQLFYNPSDNDIEVLKKTLIKLENAQKTELCSIIYRKINEIIEPNDLNKALLFVVSIEYIDQEIRKSKLEPVTKFESIEESEKYGLFLFELAKQYKNLSEYEKAIEFFEKSMAIDLKIHGENHTSTAIGYAWLGNAWSNKGQHDKALEFLEKSLTIKLKIHGETHPSTGKSFNEIGLIWRDKGFYNRAIEYFQKSLAINLKVHGNQHPDTGITYNNIGLSFSDKGDYTKAIEYFQKFLTINIKVKGENHSSTGTSCNNLGFGWSNLGEYDKALVFYKKSLAITLIVHGEVHPETSATYNNIGMALQNKGDFDNAIEPLEKSLTINLIVHGEQHPETGTSYNNLGTNWRQIGDISKSIEYLEKSLEIRLNVFGEKHPDTGATYNNLGLALYDFGDYNKALNYAKKSLTIDLKVHGSLHPSTGISYHNLGLAWNAKGNLNMAIKNYKKSLNIKLKTVGNQHPDTAYSYFLIGICYQDQEKYEKAIEYYLNAYKIQQKGGFPYRIAQCYEAISLESSALQHYLESAELRKNDSECGINHSSTLESAKNALRLAKILNKEELIPNWIKELKE